MWTLFSISNYQKDKGVWNSYSGEILQTLLKTIKEAGPRVLELTLDLLSLVLGLDVDWKKHMGMIVPSLISAQKIHKTVLIQNSVFFINCSIA